MIHLVIEYAARAFELLGIGVMLIGTAAAFANGARHWDYDVLRRRIARSILLGLELLIASDIISTITVQPTLRNVAVLGLIVIIRTFLSFTLELEATGKLPWQSGSTARE